MGKELPLASTEPAGAPAAPRALPTPAALALLALLALLGFSRPTLQGFPAVFQDRAALADNPAVRDGRAWQALTGALLTPASVDDRSGAYQPLTVFSLALNRAITGESPMGFHLVNLILHLLASILLFFLARAVLADGAAALLAAGLFACHPMAAGAVSWITGRAELQMTVLALGALLLHRGRDGSAGRSLAPAMALLAMLSQEAGLSLVLLAPLVDYAAVKQPGAGRGGVFRYFGIWLAAVVYVLLRAHVQPYQMEVGLTPPLLVALTVLKLWSVSALLAVLPVLSLVVAPVRLGGPGGSEFLARAQGAWAPAGAVALLALAGVAIWQLRKNPPAGAGLVWFLVGFLPLASLTLAMGALMDRLLYFPLAGLCLAAGALAARGWHQRPASARVIQGVAVGMGILFLALAGFRTGLWADEAGYLKQVAARNPRDVRTRADLGAAYTRMGRPDLAVGALRQAFALDSTNVQITQMLGRAYTAAGRPDSAAALLGPVADYQPDQVEVESALGDAMTAMGKHQDAMRAYSRAIQEDSTHLQSYVGIAQSLALQGRFQAAAAALIQASKVNAADPAVPNNLGLVLQSMGRVQSADSAFQAAIRMDPRTPQFHMNRARLLFHHGDYEAAGKEVDILVGLMPGNPGPLQLREQLRARMRTQPKR